MKPKPWIAVIFLVMAVTLLVAWVEAQSRLRRGVIYDAPPKPLTDEAGLVLIGTLGPLVTTRIDARNLDLAVPVNSWVHKGQLIGEADSAAAPEQANQEVLGAEDANAAVAAAIDQVREIDDELAAEEKYEFERREQQVESGVGSRLRAIDPLGRAPVVSPADGLLVASDVFPGTFGIASDANLLCVHTHVHQVDIASLRFGQPALIEMYGDPTVALRAKISGIGGTLIVSPDGAAYPITLSVEDPAGKRFSGASVRIRLQTTGK